MKRASYMRAVEWIAENDSGGNADALDPVSVSELITSCLVADIFGVPYERVGNDVVNTRKRWRKLADAPVQRLPP